MFFGVNIPPNHDCFISPTQHYSVFITQASLTSTSLQSSSSYVSQFDTKTNQSIPVFSLNQVQPHVSLHLSINAGHSPLILSNSGSSEVSITGHVLNIISASQDNFQKRPTYLPINSFLFPEETKGQTVNVTLKRHFSPTQVPKSLSRYRRLPDGVEVSILSKGNKESRLCQTGDCVEVESYLWAIDSNEAVEEREWAGLTEKQREKAKEKQRIKEKHGKSKAQHKTPMFLVHHPSHQFRVDVTGDIYSSESLYLHDGVKGLGEEGESVCIIGSDAKEAIAGKGGWKKEIPDGFVIKALVRLTRFLK
ncbi:hypothetical protein BLNAU_3675 [Blattamonas nauphoetae]|uniref:Nucleoplasmin-like domain-containing protein n=1 Tax=Blattamonas nauphoetae TaxID=2049346 RepID=A0ABQ9YBX0_9EUKA|nr:hypothetical protein BLNAU_3675 [Blattamonas nauphoetae]